MSLTESAVRELTASLLITLCRELEFWETFPYRRRFWEMFLIFIYFFLIYYFFIKTEKISYHFVCRNIEKV